MLRGATVGLRLQRRLKATLLNWPLPEKERLSERMHDIERHWKTRPGPSRPSVNLNDLRGEARERLKYVLAMFPYPSGNLHMGHMRVYTISDVLARYYRLAGHYVIHPIGWDAFGLPAENAARERGVDPREWTLSNIETMRDQLLRTGVEFDWPREISTCSPEFYTWTQWIFCRMHDHGLLRRGLAEVNWDPVDETVLAAEQIDTEGRSWRSGAITEKRKLRQWLVETPKYAKRLAEGLKNLPEWHEVADIQANWIGPCDVFRFILPVQDVTGKQLEEVLDLRVHEPLKLANANFVVLKANHSLVKDRGMKLDGEPKPSDLRVLNGVSGVWMPVVVVPEDFQKDSLEFLLDAVVANSKEEAEILKSTGLEASTRSLMSMNRADVLEIAQFGKYGGYETSRKIVDWVVSRQRAWGTPIPVLIAEDGVTTTILQNQELPLLQGVPGIKEKVPCDRLPGGYGYYETDTLDTFFDSSWYFLRYLDPRNDKELISKRNARWTPVDVYVGGVEHAAVHMFYARFVSMFLADMGVIPPGEPFKALVPQGIVRGRTFVDPQGAYVKPTDVEEKDGKYRTKDGRDVEMVFEKMSKSKGNGVEPLQVLERDGMDLIRLQLLDSAAPRAPINWGDSDLKGLQRWMDRVAWAVSRYIEGRRIKDAGTEDVDFEEMMRENYNYFVRNTTLMLDMAIHNTAIARLQGLTNALRKADPARFGSSVQIERCIRALIVMMQVFAPHTAREYWAALQEVSPHKTLENKELSSQLWPQVDPDANIDFGIEVDGFNFGRVQTPRKEIEDLKEDEAMKRAASLEHKAVFKELKNWKIVEKRVEQKRGLFYTLHLRTETGMTEKDFKIVINRLTALKKKDKKERKDKKNKGSA